MKPGAATTRPAAGTEQGQGRRETRFVRWLSPYLAVTRFTVGAHVVGRDEGCETILDGDEVSRRHAEFRIDGSVFSVRDLESRNGVFVNGARVKDSLLHLGDVVRCGDSVGVVLAGAEDELAEIAPNWFGGAALAAAVAPVKRIRSDLPIVIEGESGTGKEGMARAIHTWSGRRGSFVAVNCAALPVHLVEGELFGYRKGAFTGADRANPGHFRAADGGTIFLDEVLELPAAVQPKLLRVLEQREVVPLGESVPVRVDVRVVAAAQEPLAGAVDDKRFRADLLARLDGLTVVLPPLRERRGDVIPLFRRFLATCSNGEIPRLEAKLVEALCLYEWPLNVRELFSLARRLWEVHGDEGCLRRAHLPERMLLSRGSAAEAPSAEAARRVWRPVDDGDDFAAFVEALEAHKGNVASAARAVGLSRARAYRMLAAHPEFTRGRPEPTDG